MDETTLEIILSARHLLLKGVPRDLVYEDAKRQLRGMFPDHMDYAEAIKVLVDALFL